MAVWIDQKVLSGLLASRFSTISGANLLYPTDPIPSGIAALTIRFNGFSSVASAKARRSGDEGDRVRFAASISVWSPVPATQGDGWELETGVSKVFQAMLTTTDDTVFSTDHSIVGLQCERSDELELQPDDDRRADVTVTGTCRRLTSSTLS